MLGYTLKFKVRPLHKGMLVLLLCNKLCLLNSGYPGFGYPGVVFLLIEFPLRQLNIFLFNFRIVIICCTLLHALDKLEVQSFSIGIKAGMLCLKDLIPKCDPYLFMTLFFITPFILNSFQFFNEDSNIKLFKVFNKLKNAQHSKVSHKKLKKVEQEKESLIVQLSESHALTDSLKSENTMLFNIID
jgi:hypothetical protein